MQRRLFLHGAGLSLAAASAGAKAQVVQNPLGSTADASALAPPGPVFAPAAPLARIRASVDRIIEVNLCTRPFRMSGPRIESERIGRKTVIHNYGHGGTGWSLSWGSGAIAVPLAQATGEKRIAVIGCGAVGLTAALMAQRAGLKVRIYAKERLPLIRSAWATGGWSPEARFGAASAMTPEIEQQWQTMARFSFRMYMNLLGIAGDPIQWRDSYALSDTPYDPNPTITPSPVNEPEYSKLGNRLTPELMRASETLRPGEHPFKVPFVRRSANVTFNISSYGRMLMSDFLLAGGEIETVEFTSPKDFAHIREKTIINSTGYGARALMSDESVIPVRGQNVKLIPQPEVTYSVNYGSQHVTTAARSDAMLFQTSAPDDYNNDSLVPDRAASEAAVMRLAAVL